MIIDELILQIEKSGNPLNLDKIKDAYKFANNKHDGQVRLSGEPYINHPTAVAGILVDLGLDEVTVIAGILHDTIEDSDATPDELKKRFGEKVAELVGGVTTLGEIDFSKLPDKNIQEMKFQAEIENLRRFFLAMAKDIRVVIIKLADRLHNMRTLEFLPEADQKRISRETLEIFAPLSDRLSMGQIKAELEDLAFKYANPEGYKKISSIVLKGERDRRNYLTHIKSVISVELEKEKINAQIDGRVKHLYSIYKKLNKVNQDFSKIYDLMAIRVIVENIEDCYKAMGIIHSKFKPMIYLIKDYIAVPKPNGYQSLHTTVFGIKGKITEIQIRTQKMHEEAERGIAAHWQYSENKLDVYKSGGHSFASEEKISWVNKIANWQKNIKSGQELAEELKIDLFNDRIFVLSPKGNIFDLPEGATPIDFAYEVHTSIGNRCRGAKVNGRIVPVNYQLNNRDVVEIILASKNDKSGPARDWLEFTKTAKARQRIRSWFKKLNREENILEGQKLLTRELDTFGVKIEDVSEAQKKKILDDNNWREWSDLLSSIGEGSISTRQVVKWIVGQRLYNEIDQEKNKKAKTNEAEADKPKEAQKFSNLEGILVRYAGCCKPKKGDAIKGFITRGQGITIHRADCHSLLTSPMERIIDVDFSSKTKITTKVEIIGDNRVGLVRDVTSLIAHEDIIIDDLKAYNPEKHLSKLTLVFTVDDPTLITDILPKIQQIIGVKSVRKK